MKQRLSSLYSEHEHILHVLNTYLPTSTDKSGQIPELIRFLRQYADLYHHRKEEEILFPAMIMKNPLMGEGILREMNNNHEEFRELLSAAETVFNQGDPHKSLTILCQYAEMLKDHIAAENDEVFPAAESLFTDQELSILEARMEDSDRELGLSQKAELLKPLFVQ